MVLKTQNGKKIIINDKSIASFKKEIERGLVFLEGKVQELTIEENIKHDEYNDILNQIDRYRDELNESIIKLIVKSKKEGLTKLEMFELTTSMNTYNSLIDSKEEVFVNTLHF